MYQNVQCLQQPVQAGFPIYDYQSSFCKRILTDRIENKNRYSLWIIHGPRLYRNRPPYEL